MRIFLTGATGFIGSYIADKLFSDNHSLMLAKRTNSSLKNCELFANDVLWVDTDKSSWQREVIDFQPEIIIHSAWLGVEAKDRDDYDVQRQNLDLVTEILDIAQQSPLKTIIGFGSQAEYGYLDSVVEETRECRPEFAYAKIKLEVLEMIKCFAQTQNIDWYWLRVFSVRGKREGQNWLLPSFEQKLKDPNQTHIDLTSGEQKYAYLPAEELASYVKLVIDKVEGKSGIYNISGVGARSLKSILTEIRDRQRPDFKLNFGALPTRPGQNPIIEGSMKKFFSEFKPN